MEYITTHEAAEKWGITKRRVQILCSQGRINGALRMGIFWVIPKNADKPVDGRKSIIKDKNKVEEGEADNV